MGEVHKFGRTILPGEANGDLVSTLEGLLAQARSGDLRGVAYCTVRVNGVLGTGWDGSDGTRYPLGAAIGMLNVRYHTLLLEGRAAD